MTTEIHLKRVYEAASPTDGARVLVDRLWPRGVSKDRAALDSWAKEAAPSTDLRQRWHADADADKPSHFARFTVEYQRELEQAPAADALERLVDLAREHSRLTLVYGARNEATNHAVVLREALLSRLQMPPR
ncbi:DUF488 domain-containing protein [Leucobacter sp. NPDC058333]|uniref:DUF488 domain-containing protein n=1 Tax=Leucobacter sp. NPDC058333 TaxID=3346450 RepID=UPI00364BB565